MQVVADNLLAYTKFQICYNMIAWNFFPESFKKSLFFNLWYEILKSSMNIFRSTAFESFKNAESTWTFLFNCIEIILKRKMNVLVAERFLFLCSWYSTYFCPW